MNKAISTIVVSFMGVDGSGKSTLIKKIRKKLNTRFVIKYLHLRPYLFLTDKRNVIKNPHKLKKKQLKIISFLRLLIWFFLYKLFFYFNVKKKNR